MKKIFLIIMLLSFSCDKTETDQHYVQYKASCDCDFLLITTTASGVTAEKSVKNNSFLGTEFFDAGQQTFMWATKKVEAENINSIDTLFIEISYVPNYNHEGDFEDRKVVLNTETKIGTSMSISLSNKLP